MPKVVIIGAGFAGLAVARQLRTSPVDVLMIDRSNHHLFQPLLYQVATGSLAESDIAAPIREVLRKQRNTEVIMGEVTAVDKGKREVRLDNGQIIPYDTLVIATGANHSYFGHPEWAPMAPGIKALEDALSIRDRILIAFELAERCGGGDRCKPYLTFAIVGGGPTGVELAGAIAEMAHKGMHEDFRVINPKHVRVILIEAGPRILPSFAESLSDRAVQMLAKLGVEVMTHSTVTDVTEEGVHIGGQLLGAATVLWAAGNQASGLAATLDSQTDRAGRIMVEPDLTVPGHPELFVLGDTAHCRGSDGKPLPAVATVAIQQGNYVGKLIKNRVAPESRRPFRYFNKGQLATIGRFHAVAQFGHLKLSGVFAWFIWAVVHIAYLVDFTNRLVVVTRWFFWLFLRRHTSRLILQRFQAHWTNPLRKDEG
jgi:NADH dehydrogenase